MSIFILTDLSVKSNPKTQQTFLQATWQRYNAQGTLIGVMEESISPEIAPYLAVQFLKPLAYNDLAHIALEAEAQAKAAQEEAEHEAEKEYQERYGQEQVEQEFDTEYETSPAREPIPVKSITVPASAIPQKRIIPASQAMPSAKERLATAPHTQHRSSKRRKK